MPYFPQRAVAAAALSALTFMPSALSSAPMNVLFIISDDLRPELGCYGGLASTPYLDQLAHQGVQFNRAYAQCPLCNPSRTSLLTGRSPPTTQIYGNREWFGATHPDWVSLPRYFKMYGYITVRCGKIFHGGIDDTEAWVLGGEPRREKITGSTPDNANSTLKVEEPSEEEHSKPKVEPRSPDPNVPKFLAEQVETDGNLIQQLGDNNVVDRSIKFLRRQRKKPVPFFLACGLYKPHTPFVAPKAFFELYNAQKISLPIDFAARPTLQPGFPLGSLRETNTDLFAGVEATPEEAREAIRSYLACVSYVDESVGRIVAELETLQLRQHTIIVICSDHGFHLGEKGKWSKAAGLWEQGARIPLIIIDPRVAGNGHPCERVVELLDLYPTLVELCGLPNPNNLEGHSLVPLLKNPDRKWDYPAHTVWSEHGKGISGLAIRTERYTYYQYYGPGAGIALIDHDRDPHELHNVAAVPEYEKEVAFLKTLAQPYVAGQAEAPAGE